MAHANNDLGHSTLSAVAQACHLSTWEAEAGEPEFKFSLGYTVKDAVSNPNQNKKKTYSNGSKLEEGDLTTI